jgi:SAM-dependent methyltransferase
VESGFVRGTVDYNMPEMTAPYSQIAEEYYDCILHKTSRNFDETGRLVLDSWRGRIPPAGRVLDVGAGRGRCNEYLGIDCRRVVQLDSSEAMLAVEPREDCLVRVRHIAEELPFPSADFGVVTAFLCDPYLGLNFLEEAYRVLQPGGVLIGTTPSRDWGEPLRKLRGVDDRTTRFINKDRVPVLLPSNLFSENRVREMLERVGFDKSAIHLQHAFLPPGTSVISDDIVVVAKMLGLTEFEVPLLVCFYAQKAS